MRGTPHRSSTGLRPESRVAVAEMLNARLADALDLYTQTKHAHWNVKGQDFYQLHLLFDDLAETVEKHVDLVAERITALGGKARGTVRMAAAESSLPEMPEKVTGGMEFVTALVERYAKAADAVRGDIDEAEEQDDKATADLLTDIVRDLDQALYFLESHLEGKPTKTQQASARRR